MADVELKGITKVYKNVRVVDKLDFAVRDKEFVVLLGPTGCGKSTVLRMIAEFEDITEGELYIDGEFMNDVPHEYRNVFMVSQDYNSNTGHSIFSSKKQLNQGALSFKMTVYENMAYTLKTRKVPKDEIDRRIKEAARILSIEAFLYRKPITLSPDQQLRAAIGRAIVCNPKVFLFDDPLSEVDASLRASIREELLGLHHRLNATVIYATSDQEEAMSMADKVLVMEGGKIKETLTNKEKLKKSNEAQEKKEMPMDFQELVNQGIAFFQTGEKGEALKKFKEALVLQPDNADVQQLIQLLNMQDDAISQAQKACADEARSRAELNGITDVNQTINEYTEALKRNPNDTSAKDILVQAYYIRGLLFQSEGDYVRAIEDYSEGIKNKPDLHYNIYHKRGSANLAIKNFDQAIEDYERLINQFHQDDNHTKEMLASAYSQRGYAASEKGDHARAVADFEMALKINPNDSQTRELYDMVKAKM